LLMALLHMNSVIISLQFVLFSHHPKTAIPSSQHSSPHQTVFSVLTLPVMSVRMREVVIYLTRTGSAGK
jgi:hypothetical protein